MAIENAKDGLLRLLLSIKVVTTPCPSCVDAIALTNSILCNKGASFGYEVYKCKLVCNLHANNKIVNVSSNRLPRKECDTQ